MKILSGISFHRSSCRLQIISTEMFFYLPFSFLLSIFYWCIFLLANFFIGYSFHRNSCRLQIISAEMFFLFAIYLLLVIFLLRDFLLVFHFTEIVADSKQLVRKCAKPEFHFSKIVFQYFPIWMYASLEVFSAKYLWVV